MLPILKSIIKILSDGTAHSHEQLCDKLQITPQALLKLLSQCKNYDVDIVTDNNNCLQIPHGIEFLDLTKIQPYIDSQRQHHLAKTVIFDTISSTNTYLADCSKNSANQINICLAENQTAGRGRLGRSWVSPYAKNIYLSLLWKFTKEPAALRGLGLAVAVATLQALQEYGIKKDIYLKWPNDVLWQRHKLAGILVELFSESPQVYNAIIGVGINVDMPQSQGQKITQPWCDVATITNAIPQRNKLAGILLNQLLIAMELYQNYGLPAFLEQWRAADICYTKPLSLITPTATICGTGMGIDAHGNFLLRDTSGKILTFASGEVSLRL